MEWPRSNRLSAVSVAVMCLFVGCLGGVSGGTPTVSTDTPSPTTETPRPGESTATTTPAFPEWSPSGPPFEEIEIGTDGTTADRPHSYTIWNHANDTRDIAIRLVQNGTVIHEQQYAVPPQRTLAIVLRTPAEYELTVRIDGPAITNQRTFIDPIESFDCNTKGTEVAILPHGGIVARSFQTEIACHTPTATPSD